MHDIKYIRKNFDEFQKKMYKRNPNIEIKPIQELDKKRLELISQVEKLKEEKNNASRDIGNLMKQGNKQEAEAIKERMKNVSEEIKILDDSLAQIEKELTDFLLEVPNILDDSVPTGKDENENVEIRKWGQIRNYDFTPLPHEEIAEKLGILNLEVSAKLSGARFSYLSGKGAQLERALINFFLDIHTQEHGYTEALPPFMVNSRSMTGTGQLPKFKEDAFKIEGRDLYLIPTAEVPLTNVFSDDILNEANLPVYLAGYTPCFRSEAGSYGKDTKGLIRLHQFNKVELVKITTPETSEEEHEKLLLNAEKILQLLHLPYRVVLLCSGDTGFSAAKCYDLEVFLPSQGKYREISSVSNFKDFQARRANIRYRRKEDQKTEFVHTINGSGLAVGRTWLAILENYQNSDGSVTIPDILVRYTGFKTIQPIK